MIDVIASVNWISLLVLSITLLLFKALVKISYKVNWTFVILISMVMGGVNRYSIRIRGEHVSSMVRFNRSGICKSNNSTSCASCFNFSNFRIYNTKR